MKILLIVLFVLTGSQISAQEKGLSIKNVNTGKEKFIKEHRRIKITTQVGKKLVGRLKILDGNTIKLRRKTIALSEIKKVKRHPVVGSIGNSIGFLALASGTFVTGTSLYAFSSYTDKVFVYYGIGLSIGAIYATTLPINLFDKGRSVNMWKFTIQTDQ